MNSTITILNQMKVSRQTILIQNRVTTGNDPVEKRQKIVYSDQKKWHNEKLCSINVQHQPFIKQQGSKGEMIETKALEWRGKAKHQIKYSINDPD